MYFGGHDFSTEMPLETNFKVDRRRARYLTLFNFKYNTISAAHMNSIIGQNMAEKILNALLLITGIIIMDILNNIVQYSLLGTPVIIAETKEICK